VAICTQYETLQFGAGGFEIFDLKRLLDQAPANMVEDDLDFAASDLV
jgi:hypothetical protein